MKSLDVNRLTTPARNIGKSKVVGAQTPAACSTSKLGGSSKLGATGENIAEKFLVSKGYKTLSRNYRIRGGEIDIVAKKGGIIVFVEVKMRRGTRFGEAFEAIDYRKKQKLLRAIRHYLSDTVSMANLPPFTPWQCDLIAIQMPAPGSQWKQGAGRKIPTAEIRHYKNIFLI